MKKLLTVILASIACLCPALAQNIASDAMQSSLDALEKATQSGDEYAQASAFRERFFSKCVANPPLKGTVRNTMPSTIPFKRGMVLPMNFRLMNS